MTKHLNESIAFYRDVLGFQEIVRPNFDFAGAWLFNYGLQIHLIVNESIPDAEGPIQTHNGHLAFEVEDFAAVEPPRRTRHSFRKNTVAQTGACKSSSAIPTAITSKSAKTRRRSSQNNDQNRRSRQDVEPRVDGYMTDEY